MGVEGDWKNERETETESMFETIARAESESVAEAETEAEEVERGIEEAGDEEKRRVYFEESPRGLLDSSTLKNPGSPSETEDDP